MTTYRELLAQVKTEIEEIDAAALADELAGAAPPLLIDVREPDEYEQGAIAQALHIPRGFLESRIEAAAPDKGARIVLSCASGARSAFGAKALHQVGRKKIILKDSTWEIRAATPNLHGGSYDLIVVDETWDISSEVLDTALRPSQIARRSSMMLHFSTAGDTSSTALMALRERALAEIDADTPTDLYLAEWSMPPGCDGELYWGYANPALGRTIDIKALRSASTRESFRRSHLNQWITARGAMLDSGVWEATVTDLPVPTGGILAVDSSLDESRYVGIRAAMTGEQVIVDTAFSCQSEDEMWAEIERIMGDDKTITLAVTPSLEIHLPPDLRRRHVLVGYGELLRYTALVKAMIVEGRVVHRPSQLLTEHINRAVAVKTAQGLVVSSQKSPGPIEMARCAIWAIALVSKPVSRQKPILVVSR